MRSGDRPHAAEAKAARPAQVSRPARRGKKPAAPVRRQPRQARARETARAILQAAAALLAERGYGGVTTNAIAERAGVSIGSLYQYFPDKGAILSVLRREHVAAVRPVIDRFVAQLASPQVPIEVSLRAFFGELVALHGADPQLCRALDSEVPWPHDSDRDSGREAAEIVRAAEILRRRPDVAVGDPVAAAHVLHQATSALSRWLVHSAPDYLDRKAYVDEAVRMLSGFLRGPGAPGS